MDEEGPVRHRLSALEMIEHNKPLRKHWMARLIAMLLDFIIVAGLGGLIGLFIEGGLHASMLPEFMILTNIIMALFWVFYSAIMEYAFGFTLGKKVMHLRVQSLKGPLYLWKTILRNISKVQVIVLVIDALVGMATAGDPRQKFLDRIAETTVIREGKTEKHGSETEI